MKLRSYQAKDRDAIIQLNAQYVHFLSPMDGARFDTLYAMSAFVWVVEVDEAVVGFMLTFREGQRYDSENYRWFARNYDTFLYVDRIVSDHPGAGAIMYTQLIQWAADNAIARLVAEIDSDPPNPKSFEFHRRFGFVEVGQQRLASAKNVSLQAREID